MKMTEFMVEYFRGIINSGWIKLSDIATIVGKNESSKTSLLKALWKLNPAEKENYNMDREWPRGRRKERDEDKTVVTARFEFSKEQQDQIAAIDPIYAGTTGVEVKKTYKGDKQYKMLPKHVYTSDWAKAIISNLTQAVVSKASAGFKKSVREEIEKAAMAVTDSDMATAKKACEQLKKALPTCVTGTAEEAPVDHEALKEIQKQVDSTIAVFSAEAPYTKAKALIEKWMPKFIYMDDHKTFVGTAHLDQVKQRKDKGHLTEDDKTIILIMEMAGLDLEDEVTKGGQTNREQRQLDMNDASQTLTTEIATRWRQKKYEVQFNVDGHHFMTFVKDQASTALVPLEERSKGFQWFFSFDMKFMYETEGTFENAIILLDEPGLHLHAEAQRDLLQRFKEYAKNNQLIYSTHLPFMIDCGRFDNIWVAEETGEGAKFHQNWESADKDARFTLQAALGISWSQSLFVGQNNLVVEGITDFWMLDGVSNLFNSSGKAGIKEGLVITSAGGATKAAYLGTLLNGQELNVAVMLDSDTEGKSAQQQLVKNWVLKDDHVLMLGNLVGKSGAVTLEDLFDETYYLEKTTEAYAAELKGKSFKVTNDNRPLVERINEAMAGLGVENFNKGRVAKKIMTDLAQMTYADLDKETQANFSKVFDALNKILHKWTGKTASEPKATALHKPTKAAKAQQMATVQ